MPEMVNVHEAKTNLSRLPDRVCVTEAFFQPIYVEVLW